MRTVAPVRIPRGDSEVRLEVDRIDPGSLAALDAGIRFLGWRYDAADNDVGLLIRAVGRTLRVVSHDRTDTLDLTVELARPLRLPTVPARRMAHDQFRFELLAPGGGLGTVSYRVRYR